jgi:phosphatidylglycerol:prolipoprotein diacylglycerol transferase
MNRVLFEIGPITVYTFGVSIAVGVLAAYYLADREAKRAGLDVDKVSTLFLILLVAGILGARIFYILFYNPAYYSQHLVEIIKINEGGLSIHGGIIGAILAGWWYSRKVDLSFWSVADLLAPAAIMAQGIARVGCDVYGKAMAVIWPWGVQLQGQVVHPVQIYETLLDLALFIFLWGQRDRKKYSGQIFIYYLGFYALIRFILEFFRNNPVILASFTPAHITSVILMLFAIGLAVWRSRKRVSVLENNNVSAIWVRARVWLAVLSLAAISVSIFYTINN